LSKIEQEIFFDWCMKSHNHFYFIDGASNLLFSLFWFLTASLKIRWRGA